MREATWQNFSLGNGLMAGRDDKARLSLLSMPRMPQPRHIRTPIGDANGKGENAGPRSKKQHGKKSADKWFVYLLRCGDGSLYTGITKDITRRCEQHNAGTASATPAAVFPSDWSTRSRKPVKASP